MRNGAFVVLVVLFLGTLFGFLSRHYIQARQAADTTWNELFGRLTRVDRNNVAMIALDVINDAGQSRDDNDSFSLEPTTVWRLVGGLEGLEAMEKNCQVLVEMAAYLQRWYPEALVIAEQLRLNAREVEWHIGRLRAAAQSGNLQSSFSEYAQRATAIYYVMTRQILRLYEQANVPQLGDLQRAI